MIWWFCLVIVVLQQQAESTCAMHQWLTNGGNNGVESHAATPCSQFSTKVQCREQNFCCFANNRCFPANIDLVECSSYATKLACPPAHCKWENASCKRACPFTSNAEAFCSALATMTPPSSFTKPPSPASPVITRFPTTSSRIRPTSFLVMLADDLGYGDVTYLKPSPMFSTPNIDAMSRSPHAMRMDRFHSPGTTCSPSRAAMVSGRAAVKDCVWGANTEFDKPNVVFRPNYPFKGLFNETLGRLARNNGYKTFFGGKWHVSAVDELQTNFGFDHYLVSGGNLPSFDATCFCETSKAQCFPGHYTDKNRLSINYGCTIQQSPTLKSIQTNNRTSASVFADAFDKFLHEKVGEKEAFFAIIGFSEPHLPFIAPEWVRNPLLATVAMKKLSAKEASLAADYYGSIQGMDAAVGQIRNSLVNAGRSDDTLVIFTSDNGPEVLNFASPATNGYGDTAGLRGAKRSLYEGGHRVPAIIEWPDRIQNNIVSEQVISMLDVTATIMELMLENNPSVLQHVRRKLDGVPITDFSSNWTRKQMLHVCSSITNAQPSICQELAVIQGDFKLIAKINNAGAVQSTEYYNYAVSETKQISKTGDKYEEIFAAAKAWVNEILVPSIASCKM